MFNSIIGEELTLVTFLICIGVALALGFIISLVHMKGEKYSKNFASTLVIIPALISTVIMMVNGNLGTSIAILGSFSLIRFRSIPGTAREIINVFFAMAVGLACGTGYVAFAILITLIVGLVSLLLTNMNIFENKNTYKVLKVQIPEELDYTEVFNDIFKKFASSVELTKSKTVNMGSMFELTYNVKLKNDMKEKNFIDEIRVRNGNLKVSLSHPIMEEGL